MSYRLIADKQTLLKIHLPDVKKSHQIDLCYLGVMDSHAQTCQALQFIPLNSNDSKSMNQLFLESNLIPSNHPQHHAFMTHIFAQ